jgi:hypothetical protein
MNAPPSHQPGAIEEPHSRFIQQPPPVFRISEVVGHAARASSAD